MKKKSVFQYVMYGLGIVTALSVVLVVGLAKVAFSVGIMWLFGFTYQSFLDAFWFYLLTSAISFPMEMLTRSGPYRLFRRKQITKKQAYSLTMSLDVLGNAFAMWLSNVLVPEVSATSLSIMMVSILMSPFSIYKEKYNEAET